MVTTKSLLRDADARLEESMGQRSEPNQVWLAPTPKPADVGRRPLPHFGRIEIDRVLPDPDQPRCVFDDDAISRLATSLASAGQLAPIRVRWSDCRRQWLIVAGERRWRAAKQAGFATIECYFYSQQLDEAEILRVQLVENLLRENLRPIEEARGFRRLMEQQGLTGKELAAELSVPESKISRAIALLRLPEDIQAQVEEGHIAPRVAYEIARAPSPGEQRRLAALAVSGGAGVKEISRATRSRSKRGKASRQGVKLAFPLDEGWRVTVSRRRAASYHEVEQALMDALEEVRTRIRGGVQLF